MMGNGLCNRTPLNAKRETPRLRKVVLAIASESSSARRTGVAVSGVMLVIFLFAIDGTIVSAAMPTIVGKLGGLELYSWVFSTYMLTSALATPLCGKLSDLYGRRRLMLMGIGLFTLGSALCGMAQSMEQLIVFRAIQGVGGGAIYALSFIIVGFLFPPDQRAKMQGLISSIWGVASILGPLAGGIITQYWSWRWIFFVNVPVSLTATLLIVSGLTETETEDGRRRAPDLKGAAALLLGLFLLFYALEKSRKSLFALDPALAGSLILAFAALALFYMIERRAEEPILPTGLFRLRIFRISAGLSWLASMGIFGVISYLPLYVQGVLGASASRAGMTLVLASLGWTAGSFIGGQGMNRFGYRVPCIAGMLLMALGYGSFVASKDHLGLVPVLAVGSLIGLGMGIVNVTSMVAAQNSAPLRQLGVATSTVMLFRMFGGAFGISLMGSVLFSQMQRRLVTFAAAPGVNISGSLVRKLANPQNLLDPATRDLIPDSLLATLVDILGRSMWSAFFTGFMIMLLGLGLSFFMASTTPANTLQAPKPGAGPDRS